MSSNKIVYPGTFDPFTFGHEDLVRRALRLFESVIVGVARNNAKNPCFSLEDRISMTQELLQKYPNVTVIGFDGLLIDFLKENKASKILRGLRAVSDFEYEFQMAGMNRKIYPHVETVFLTPGEEYMFISATMVREIASLQGDVSQFVDPYIDKKLKIRYEK